MKQLIFIVFLGISAPSFGQDSTQFLISSKPLQVRLQAAVGYEGSFVNQIGLHSTGLELGLLFNKQFYLGAYSFGSFNNPRNIVVSSMPINTEAFTFFYQQGVRVGYHFSPYKSLHVAAQSQFGFVSINSTGSLGADPINKNTFAYTPSIEAEVNLTRFVKLSIGAGYRFVDHNEPFFKQNKVNSFIYNATFRFGRFAK